MSRVIDQRLISSAMLAALAEHDGADTLKIFEMPIKVCISYTSKVGEVINDKDVIAELDNRFTIHNMPLAVFHKICGRMSKGKNKVLESLPNNTYRLIADLTTIEEEFRRQENLTNAEIMQIIEKLKNGLKKKCLDLTKMKIMYRVFLINLSNLEELIFYSKRKIFGRTWSIQLV